MSLLAKLIIIGILATLTASISVIGLLHIQNEKLKVSMYY